MQYLNGQTKTRFDHELKQGMAFMNQGELVKATEIFTAIMRQNPSNFAAIEQMGVSPILVRISPC